MKIKCNSFNLSHLNAEFAICKWIEGALILKTETKIAKDGIKF